MLRYNETKLTLDNRCPSQMSKFSFFSKTFFVFTTVKPLITNTSEEFNKCRLYNFSMSFILYYVNFSICENK